MDEFTLESTDGVDVFCRRWLPPGDRGPRSSSCTVRPSTRGGTRASPRCCRPRGTRSTRSTSAGTGGPRGSTERGRIGPGGMPGVVADVEALIRRARAEVGDCPVIVLGHSMGSVVVQALVVRAPTRRAGTCSPGTMGPAEGTDEFVAGLRAAWMPAWPTNPSTRPADTAIRSSRANELRLAEPRRGRGRQVHRRSAVRRRQPVDLRLRGRGARDHRRSDGARRDRAYPAGTSRYCSSPATPIRCPRTVPRFASSSGAYRDAGLDVTARYYAGARHEVLNETNRDEVHRDLVDWLDGVRTRRALA